MNMKEEKKKSEVYFVFYSFKADKEVRKLDRKHTGLITAV